MREQGVKAMKSVIVIAVMAIIVSAGCANSEQSIFIDSFIPALPENNCTISLDSKVYYSKGFVDIYFTDNYSLTFRLVNEMGTTAETGQGTPDAPIDSQEANIWKMKYVILEYELPGVPAMDASVWGRREIPAQILVDNDGGKITKTIELLTAEQHLNLRQIFSAFDSFNPPVSFDWETYPIIVTVQAEGEKQGGGDIIRSNKLQFQLVPAYGEMIMAGAVYLDKGWKSDEEIKADSKGNLTVEEQLLYERDKDIYDTIMNYCDFPTEHLVGCLPGQDFGLVDCYTYMGVDQAIEALLPSYNCCPKKAPEAPTAPDSGE